MADYDFSKPAPDRSHRVPTGQGSGMGGVGFILVGVVLVVLYAVFGGAAVPLEQDPSTAPAVEPAPLPSE
jgi:hypothetical protein